MLSGEYRKNISIGAEVETSIPFSGGKSLSLTHLIKRWVQEITERTFDVVVAGDVIEHVYNQGLFLNNIHKHLNDEGKLIITTPNAKWPTVILKPNPTHTLWHDRFTLEYILKEHGFKIDKFLYYYGNKKNYNLVARLLTMRQSICVICSKA